MKHKWLAAGISAVLLCTFLSGCAKHVKLEDVPIVNYTAPAEGEDVVVIHVRDYGDITIKLFPDLLPEACENFTTLAKTGYYDELIFQRVIENFMIQGGDPKGDNTGGESCWGGKFDGGYTNQLLHLPGAVAYANSGGTNTDGSQFYIVTGVKVEQAYLDEITEQDGVYFPPEAQSLYLENGGYPWLDGGAYTVFGQVVDGLDVVYAISQVGTNENDKPIKAVYMDSVTVEQYDGREPRWNVSDYPSLQGGAEK